MSDQENTELDLTPDAKNVDWFLQNLVMLANYGVELGVTLTLGGSVITGTLISGKRYFDLVQKSFEPTLEGSQWKDLLNEFFEQNAARYQ